MLARWLKILSFSLPVLMLPAVAIAANSGITYQGRILRPDGAPLSGANTQFKLQIRTPDANNCLMYEEVQALDLRNSNGQFSLTINDGTGSRTDATGLNLDRIFANRGTFTFDPTTCASGSSYATNTGDGRILVVLFKDETMSTWEPIPPAKINFVPFAFESKQIAGFTADSLLRVVNGSGDPLTGVAPLSNAQYTELMALVNGTSNAFTKAGQLGGVALPAMTSGEVLGWNGSSWVSQPAVAGPNSVTTTMIQNNAVDSTKLANGAVGTTQIASNVTINTSGTVGAAVTTTRDFKIYAAAPSAFNIDMQAPALAASYSLIWPLDDGNAGEVLTTNGFGVMSWAPAAAASQWTTHGSNISYDGGGNVGIGTTAPGTPLAVVSSTATTGGSNFQVFNDYTVANVATSSGNYWGQKNASSFKGAGNLTGQLVSAEFEAARNDPTAATASRLIGAVGTARNDAAGTTTNATGVLGYARATSGTITTGIGGKFEVTASSGTVSTGYGLYVGNVQATTKYSVYASDATAPSYFAGNVGIGTTSPSAPLEVSADGSGGGIRVSTFAGGPPQLAFAKARGTAAAPTAVQSGDALFTLSALAYGTTAYSSSVANVTARATENNTDTAHGSKLVFETTPNGTATRQTRLTIDQSGNVGIGTTLPSALLQLKAGTATAGTAPLKFTSGTLLSTPEDGAVEYDSATGLYFTIGSTRYVIPTNTTAGNFSNVSTISNAAGSITMTPMAGNSVIVNQSTASTSSSTGALIVNGGVGVAGAINSGGNIATGGSVTAAVSAITPQLYGSTAAAGDIRIDGTSNASKGNVYLASAGGKVGIGTTSPTGILDVRGGTNATGTGESITLQAQNGAAGGFNGGDIYLTPGTNSPWARIGWVKIGQTLNTGTVSVGPTNGMISGNTNRLMIGQNLHYDFNNSTRTVNGSAYSALEFFNGDLNFVSDPVNSSNWSQVTPTPLVVFKGTGNVGIGTTAPGSALDVKGAIRLSGSTSGYVGFQPAAAAGSTTYTLPSADGSSNSVLSTNGSGTLSWSNPTIQYSNTTTQVAYLTPYVPTSTTAASPVGTSTTVNNFDTTAGVGAFLKLQTNARTGYIGAVSNGAAATQSMVFGQQTGATAYNEFMRIDGSGNVGIGTTSPTSALQISSPAATTVMVESYGGGTPQLSGRSANGTAAAPTATQSNDFLFFSGGRGHTGSGFTSTSAAGMYILAAGNWSTTSQGASITFETTPTGSTTSARTERVRITNAGDVGIGTSAPTTKLDVVGSIRSVGTGGASTANSTTTIDWSKGNNQSMSTACTSTAFTNMADGATYNLAVTETSATTCTFAQSGLTFYFTPANGNRILGQHTLYSFTRIGNFVYVAWATMQ